MGHRLRLFSYSRLNALFSYSFSLVWCSMLCPRATPRALNVSKIHGVPSPLSVFSRTPDASIVDLVNLDMNEDQGMTTFILRVSFSV